MTRVRHETVHYTAEEVAAKEAADAVAKAKKQKRLYIVSGVITAVTIFSCLACLAVGSLTPDVEPAPTAVATAVHSTYTPAPTVTPYQPTMTLAPEATPIPTVVVVLEGVFAPGTYIVGDDLQPGTYRGQAGERSCYWARLSGLSGELEDIIANDNATGQFYIEVKESDFALETACRIERMSN